MYKFHYKNIERKYNPKLFFKDADSLVYEIETKDVYKDFYGIKNLFDFSDYSRDLKFFNPVNEKSNW